MNRKAIEAMNKALKKLWEPEPKKLREFVLYEEADGEWTTRENTEDHYRPGLGPQVGIKVREVTK
jgi:hypothetical protein